LQHKDDTSRMGSSLSLLKIVYLFYHTPLGGCWNEKKIVNSHKQV
jgi:hypothetical protein